MPIQHAFHNHVTTQRYGDNGWIGGWLLVGCGVADTWHAMYLGKSLKLGKIHAPADHGSRLCPTAAMAPQPQHQGMQQPADMLWHMSTLLKLENTILITINLTILRTTRQQRQCDCRCPHQCWTLTTAMAASDGHSDGWRRWQKWPLQWLTSMTVMVAMMADINNGDDHGSLSMLATGRRMERHDKFRGEPTTGGEFGPEIRNATTATKKGAPP